MDKRKVTVTTCDSMDWFILEVNGVKQAEGHKIEVDEWLEVLKNLGCETDMVFISDEEMEAMA